MTHEKFTGVTFNDLDWSGTRISRSSQFPVVNSTEIALNIPHKALILRIGRLQTRQTRKVDNKKKIRKALFVNLRPLDMQQICVI